MCLALYLGSDIKLPLNEWDEKNPAFNVSNVENKNYVEKQFSKGNIYRLGAHSGCGCGFMTKEFEIDEQDEEEVKESKLQEQSTEALIRYLNKALNQTDELELFVCWEGEQGEIPKKKETITPAQISEIAWSMDSREFYKIRKVKL